MKLFFKLALSSLLFCTVLISFSYLILQHHLLSAEFFVNHHWQLIAWRCSIYGLIIVLWPAFVRGMGAWQRWPPQIIAYLSYQKFKLSLFFITIELFIVNNMIGHLLMR